MSTLRSRPVTKPRGASATVPSVPQVNLLPPEFAQRRSLAALKRRLLFALVVVLAVAGVAYGVAMVALTSARADQAKAEAETTRLLQAQQQYAEVPQVLGQLARAEDARSLASSTEVMWAPYFRAIGTVMPEGVRLSQIAMTGATPMLAPAAPSNPLQDETVGVVAFSAISDRVLDTADWVDAMNAVPGFHDAWVSTAKADEYGGQPVYKYTSTVRVTADAYAHRFGAGEE